MTAARSLPIPACDWQLSEDGGEFPLSREGLILLPHTAPVDLLLAALRLMPAPRLPTMLWSNTSSLNPSKKPGDLYMFICHSSESLISGPLNGDWLQRCTTCPFSQSKVDVMPFWKHLKVLNSFYINCPMVPFHSGPHKLRSCLYREREASACSFESLSLEN